MKMTLILAVFALHSIAQAGECNMDFTPGYDCSTDAQAQTLLILKSYRPDHGRMVCDTETLANFGSHKEECITSAQALTYGVK